MAHEYDNAFRTMEMDCPRLLIPVVNEIFHKNYALDEKIRILPNEQMITTPVDEQIIRITDSNFMIIGAEKVRYHIECESNPNGSELLVRFFEYDTQIALDSREYQNGVLHVKLPNSAVLYLRHTKSTPDTLEMVIEDGKQSIHRRIPIVKVQWYSINEIFEKRLWFFLPFHIFVHEKELSLYNEDENKRKILMDEYQNIINRLDALYQSGEMSGLEKYSVITSIRNVMKWMARNEKNIVEEVELIMGGEVYEYEAKTIYRNGIKEGKVEGIKEGIKEGIESVAINLLRRGESEEQVSKDTGLDLDAVQKLLETITVK